MKSATMNNIRHTLSIQIDSNCHRVVLSRSSVGSLSESVLLFSYNIKVFHPLMDNANLQRIEWLNGSLLLLKHLACFKCC